MQEFLNEVKKSMIDPAMVTEAVAIVETKNLRAYKLMVEDLIENQNFNWFTMAAFNQEVGKIFVEKWFSMELDEMCQDIQRLWPFLKTTSLWYIEKYHDKLIEDIKMHTDEDPQSCIDAYIDFLNDFDPTA
jgi:hypothetical protein